MSKKNYLEILIIFVSIYTFYYYPEYLPEILIGIYAAISIDLINQNIKKFPAFNFFKKYYTIYELNKIRKRMDDILRNEELIKLRKNLIQIALLKISSPEESERKLGFQQLEQLGGKDSYDELLGILKKSSDSVIENQIVKTVCKIYKKNI